jgi:hypothetical protein
MVIKYGPGDPLAAKKTFSQAEVSPELFPRRVVLKLRVPQGDRPLAQGGHQLRPDKYGISSISFDARELVMKVGCETALRRPSRDWPGLRETSCPCINVWQRRKRRKGGTENWGEIR